ncbi:unnamed protein product [Orchesella dallaii]|uniref:Uncharacterized protein n=1 Tax=Orchesella dallaii TaxID=48710 RepID=A0ABP1QH34_9HEXA
MVGLKECEELHVKRRSSRGLMKLIKIFMLLWILVIQLPSRSTAKLTQEEAEELQRQNQILREKIRKETQAFVSQYGGQFTYEQLQAWFEAQNPGVKYFDAFPRLFSVCVTPEFAGYHDATHHISHYQPILDNLFSDPRPFYEFDLDKDSIRKETSWIEDIKLTRINSAEPDMANMRQWMHITIEAGRDLKGVYVQSIVGPLGLPFGEFSVEFPCHDDATSSDIDKAGQIAHCAYRAHAAVVHPAVYVSKVDPPRRKFHAHFKWSDITCMETPYLQFIVVAVEEFVDDPKINVHFKPILSSIYQNLGFDSRDGAPYPYYPDWRDEMYCYLKNQAEWVATPAGKIASGSKKQGADHNYSPLQWTANETVYRVQPNEDFDACVRGVVIKDAAMRDSRLLCPPGPFQCDESYSDKGSDQVSKDRQELLDKELQTSGCFPCGAPRCLDSGFDEDDCLVNNQTIGERQAGSSFVENVETYGAGRSHGIVAMMACLVLVPVSNFMARFFKEVRGDFLFGNGPWIFIHVGAHIGSLLLLWLSIGPVGPPLAEYASVLEQCKILLKNDTEGAQQCAWEKSVQNPHVALGITVFILQHLLVFFGWWRMTNNFIRGIQVIIHSHLGYFTQLLAGIAAIVAAYNNPCLDIVAFNILLVVVPFLFAGVGVALDCMTDTRVGILPRRKQWPVLEPVKLDGTGPFEKLKWIVLGCYAAVMVVLWLLTLGSYISQAANSVADIDSFTQEISLETLKSIRPKSIFGECSGDFIPGI